MLEKILTTTKSAESFKHCMIGVSLFNGYFKDAVILKLIKWAMNEFESFHLFLATTPTTYTFQAFGYSEEQAKSRMMKQARWMRNKLVRVLLEANIQNPDHHIIDGFYLEANEAFSSLYSQHMDLYNSNKNYKDDCIQTSQCCYEDSMYHYGNKSREAFDVITASQYIVWEMPVICKTTEILNVESSLFCYHRPMHMLHKVFTFKAEFSFLTDSRNGFGLLKELK